MTPTLELHKELNILTINDIIEVNILSFVRNCLHGECPDIFKEYFIYPEHRYSTRQPKLYIEPHRTNVAACRIKIKGAKLWNNLSPLIKNKSHLKSFAKIVKQNYINKY